MSSRDRACARCVFWAEGEGSEEGYGQCRRKPPSFAGASADVFRAWAYGPDSDEPDDQNLAMMGLWPVTHKSDWCGEFRESEESVKPSRVKQVPELDRENMFAVTSAFCTWLDRHGFARDAQMRRSLAAAANLYQEGYGLDEIKRYRSLIRKKKHHPVIDDFYAKWASDFSESP